MSNSSNFDFDAFYKLTDRIPVGLQLYLASSLMSNAAQSYTKYKNPLASDTNDIVDEIESLRSAHKDAAAKRAKSTPESSN